jgi:sugar phosphate permease
MKPAFGLQGWQWMFLVEGLLAVAVGICAFFVLDDGPASAKWLSVAEKQSLAAVLAEEERRRSGPSSLAALLKQPRVLLFAFIYLLIQAGVYGVIFYLPTEIAVILGTRIGLKVGLVSAVPWLVSIASTWWLSRAADRSGSRRLLASLGLAAAASAILAIPFSPPALAMASLCVAASGYIAVQPLFWTFPTGYLPAASAAAGIALINSCGNLGGFLAPNLKVWAEAQFHSATAGAIALALLTCLAAVLMAFLPDPQLKSKPGQPRHDLP